jgi:class 3 adenylate cyclase
MMVVGGLPQPRPDHAIAIASMALDMIDALAKLKVSRNLILILVKVFKFGLALIAVLLWQV